MSDLIKRLTRRGDLRSTTGAVLFNPDGEEAAAEIARLNAALEHKSKQIDEVHKEVTRLSVAVEAAEKHLEHLGVSISTTSSAYLAAHQAAILSARADEREKCANVAHEAFEKIYSTERGGNMIAKGIAAAIRARSEPKP